jgi:hypothetical protein
MENKILLGRGQKMVEMPLAAWQQHLNQSQQHSHVWLDFMTDSHQQIRYFVVKELAKGQKPVEPQLISRKLNLPLDLVKMSLEVLEKRLFFLVRNEQGAVAWAYPVTVETTPHKITFSSGEQLYAA